MHNEIRGSRLLIIFSHLVEKQRSREEHIRKETYLFFLLLFSFFFFLSRRIGKTLSEECSMAIAQTITFKFTI